jgi:alpha-tubulin suppressor-like RCC1 family protein
MMWDASTPMTITNTRDMVRGYNHFYIQKSDGTWWGVGYNRSGELSVGTLGMGTDKSYPVQMKWDASTPMTELNVLDMRAGYNQGYVLRNDGIWYAVGLNTYGSLSNGTLGSGTDQSYPVRMLWAAGQPIYATDVDEMIIGYWSVYLLRRSDNTWYGVGDNTAGQLSIGTDIHQSYPVPMLWSAGTPITSTTTLIPTNCFSMFLIKPDGTYWGVGYNGQYQLSDGGFSARYYPVQTRGAASATMTTTNTVILTTGGPSSGIWYALKSDGFWYAQGANNYGQLSRGTTESTGATDRYPQQAMWGAGEPMTTATVKDIIASNYVQIQKPDGTWWAVGNNDSYRLLDGTTTHRSYPVPMKWGDGTPIITQ